jgi:hypothetical protein
MEAEAEYPRERASGDENGSAVEGAIASESNGPAEKAIARVTSKRKEPVADRETRKSGDGKIPGERAIRTVINRGSDRTNLTD